MKLMSFDVSSVSTGWALFEDGKLSEFGAIDDMAQAHSTQERLLWFKFYVTMLLSIYKPTKIVVEETYLKNVKTLKTMMQFVGVLNVVCAEVLEVPVEFISTSTVRSHFKIKTKEEAFDYVKNKYKVKMKSLDFDKGNDMTDAVLMGLYAIDKMNGEKENG